MYIFDTLARTTFETLVTVDTLAVIDDGYVVDKMDCARRTIALAFAAGYAARLTIGHYILAATFRRTRHINLGGDGYALDETLGTSLYAKSATTAKIGVDVRISFATLYRVIGTGVNATARAHTADFAGFASARKQILTDAVAVSLIIVLVTALDAAAATHDRYRRLGIAVHRDTENVAYLNTFVNGSLSAAVQLGVALDESLGKACATGITASAAVGSRKTFLHFLDTRVFLDLSELVDDEDQHSEYKRETESYR